MSLHRGAKNWCIRAARLGRRVWMDPWKSFHHLSVDPTPTQYGAAPTGPTIIPPRLNIWQDNLSQGEGFSGDGDCHVFVRVSGGISEP